MDVTPIFANRVPSWRVGKKNWFKIFFVRFFCLEISSQASRGCAVQELTRTATVTVPLPERKGSTRSKNLKGSKTCPRLFTPH